MHAQAPGDGISLTPERPTTELGAESSYFTWQLPAGRRVTNGVVVTNGSAAAVTYAVSAVDAFTSDASGAAYRDAGDAPADAVGWIDLGASRVTVPAGGRAVVPFSVQVPSGATPGDHLAGLAFQDVDTDSTTSGPLQVTTVGRAVIGALVRVDGPAPTALAVRGAEVTREEGAARPDVFVRLDNTGRRLVRPAMTVRLEGEGYDRTERRSLDTLLPGDPLRYPVQWPEVLAPGRYRITVDLSATGLTSVRYAAAVRLLPPQGPPVGTSGQEAGSAAPARPGTGITPAFLLGVVGATVAVVLLAVGVVLTVLRRRRTVPPG